MQVFKSRKMAVLLLLGFSSGLPLFLTSRTLQLWFQDSGVDIGIITLFGLMSLPYSLKFLWSPLVDRFAPPLPFLGSQRGWLILTQLGLVLAIIAMALQKPSTNVQVLNILAITAFVTAFLSASQDIVGDAYRTDVLNPLELETGASLWVLGYRVSLFIAGSLALALADLIPWNAVYFLMAAFMAVGIIATLLAPEPKFDNVARNTSPPSFKDVFFLVAIVLGIGGLLWWVITDPCSDKTLHPPGNECSTYQTHLFGFYWILAALLIGWVSIAFWSPKRSLNERSPNSSSQSLLDVAILPLQEFSQRFGIVQSSIILVFILLYKLGDALVLATGNIFLRQIKFTKTELAAYQLMGLIATTVGVLVGGLIMTKIGKNRALWIFGVLQLVSNFGYYLLALTGKNYSMLVVAINIENFCGGLVTVVTVAYLMSLCSHHFTTTQFALFSSLIAISRDVLSAPAGDLAKATGWPSFFLITVAAAIPGLLLLPIVAPWNAPRTQPPALVE
jgi:PAT family beta-lactamase induction signal transducer AmpG